MTNLPENKTAPECVIVGIDFSYTSTGIFIGNTRSGKIQHTRITSEPDDNRPLDKIQRAAEIAKECVILIRNFLEGYGVTVDNENIHVYIEGLAFGNAFGNATRDLAGLQYMIINYLIEEDFYPENFKLVAPTALKKFATGNGKADKKMMLESVSILQPTLKETIEKCYKVSQGRYDVVDAYWLFQYGQIELFGLKGIDLSFSK